MAFKFLFFSGIFSNIFRVFLVHQNNLCKPFSFYKGFFIKIQKVKEGSVQNETM